MTLELSLTILAILLAPLIALQISEKLNQNKEARNRKLDIFRNLMATRATGLSPLHVESLNRIDIEFYDNKEVSRAWREYQDHLTAAANIATENKEGWETWGATKENLLVDLLYKMSVKLNYDFDKVLIKRGHYYPKGFEDLETEQMIIRKGLVDIFTKKSLFPVLAVPLRESTSPDPQSINTEDTSSQS